MLRSKETLLKIVIPLIITFIKSSPSAQDHSWETNGPYGGSVYTIAIDPTDSQRLMIGTIENSIYRSFNSGESWESVGYRFESPAMRVLKFHPTDPDTIYAATVSGMYKSADGGSSWTLMNPPEHPLNEYRAFAINPEYPQVLFAGGPFDRWKSTDSGQNWDELNMSSNVGVDGFTIDPQNPEVIYLVSGSVSQGKGVWKSVDLGESWISIQNNIDSTGFGEDLAVDPDNSDILYFALRDIFAESGRCLWKSLNGGQSWADITPDILSVPEILTIRISPNNGNIIFICTYGDGVLKSLDGGQTWERANNGIGVVETATLEIDPITGIIYLGTYYDGIYKSIDNGESWQKISSGIKLIISYDLAANYADRSYLYLAAANGLFRSFNGADSWERIDPGMPFVRPTTVEFDKEDPLTVYLSNGSFPPASPPGFIRTTDNGETWTLFQDGLPTDNIEFSDMTISYADSADKVILLSSNLGIYRSSDGGESWTLCQNGLPTNASYTSIATSHSQSVNVMTGTFDNRMFRSLDRGISWSELNSTPGYYNILDIEFDPQNSELLYVSVRGSGIFKSTDLGSSWLDITGNIPRNETIITGISLNQLIDSYICVYVGRQGVYQTFNAGESWQSLNNGLDTIGVKGSISSAPEDTATLYLASSPGAVWTYSGNQTDIKGENRRPNELSTLLNYPNPFNTTTVINYIIYDTEYISITIFNLLGQRIETIHTGTEQPGEHSVVWHASSYPSGVYFVRLEAGYISKTIKSILIK